MAKAKKKDKPVDLLPKRIAGVKVPKKVRRGRFGQLLASPSGQKLILDALNAGALARGETPTAEAAPSRGNGEDLDRRTPPAPAASEPQRETAHEV